MPTARGAFTFPEILPRLAVAYETGRLVPFIGVGLSRPHCADWQGLIRGLEASVPIADDPITGDTRPEELIRRANRAVRKLRASSDRAFEHAFEEALFVRRDGVPAQMKALAAIWWPLVLTTNYDNFYVKAFDQQFGAASLAVVGRGSEDCQRVLTSLGVAGRAILWALQGHVPAPCQVAGHDADRRLAAELVVDHAEYRRVTYREPHFRRAFAEVFRSRSFLFLGSGLKENYIQELFGEVLELYGASARGHYAIMPKGEVDPRFMYARFQIAVVEYGEDGRIDHGTVPDWLEALRTHVDQPEAAQVSWSWGPIKNVGGLDEGHADLEIVRARLPTERRAGECLVLSAGGAVSGDSFFVSSGLDETLTAWCGGQHPGQPTKRSSYIGEYVGHDAFAARARAEHSDVKHLGCIHAASLALFDAVASRYRVIHMQLLAAGGDDGPTTSRWSVRPFPARFALVQMVRAWGDWRRRNPHQDVRLALYVVDRSVSRELVSGRIDVLELLRCPDIAFWAEIVEDGVLLERRKFQQDESTLLRDIVDELALDARYWTFDISPVSDIDAPAGPVGLEPLASRTLRELGVVPGSTLHFRRARSR